MIKRVLIVLFIFMVLSFLALFFFTGGFHRIQQASSLLTNPIGVIFGMSSTTDMLFHLPWAPSELTQGPDISGYEDYGSQESLSDQYESLQAKAQEAQTFGNPSPDVGKLSLSPGRASASEASEEYIEVRASRANTAPISLGGWSVQSAISGIRVYFPEATSPFISGTVNTTSMVSLDPGDSATVNTANSPVGVSFRENICSGYLQQFQTFVPELSQSCPPPEQSMPLTPENIQRYGDSCIDFARTLAPCTFPASLPQTLSPECAAFVGSEFSYNGCVARFRYRSDFYGDSWQLFLGSPRELWRNTHDIIRLLDAQGRTVDAISY